MGSFSELFWVSPLYCNAHSHTKQQLCYILIFQQFCWSNYTTLYHYFRDFFWNSDLWRRFIRLSASPVQWLLAEASLSWVGSWHILVSMTSSIESHHLHSRTMTQRLGCLGSHVASVPIETMSKVSRKRDAAIAGSWIQDPSRLIELGLSLERQAPEVQND